MVTTTTPKVYARKEWTTDSATLMLWPDTKKQDVQVYRDPDAKKPFARFTWDMSNIPTRRNRYVVLNCFRYRLEWI